MSYVNEIGYLTRVLSDRNEDWEEILNSLKRFQALAKKFHKIDAKQSDITDLRCDFSKLIKDTRSKLVACTGETIIVMSKELENNFEPVAAIIFPDCIDKVSSGISYISDLYAEASKAMIAHVYMPRVIRQLVLYIQNRNARVSKVAIECLLSIITTWKQDYLSLYEADIVKALTLAVDSYNIEVKSISKSIISTCLGKYPDMAQKIVVNLPMSIRRQLSGSEVKMSSNPRSPSSSPSGRILPSRIPSKQGSRTNSQSSSRSSTRSLRCYTYNRITYSLNQVVTAELSGQSVVGTIKYIGYADANSDTVYFGLVLKTPIHSTFNGTFNKVKLFECEPGYGVLVTPVFIKPNNRSVGSPTLVPSKSVPVVKSTMKRSLTSPTITTTGSPLLHRVPVTSLSAQASPVAPKRDLQVEKPGHALSVEECVLEHKVLFANSLESARSELTMLLEFEKMTGNKDACLAYQTDMLDLITQRQKELQEFAAKLRRLSV